MAPEKSKDEQIDDILQNLEKWFHGFHLFVNMSRRAIREANGTTGELLMLQSFSKQSLQIREKIGVLRKTMRPGVAPSDLGDERSGIVDAVTPATPQAGQ